MREIKFRCWDSENKIMIDDCYIDCYNGSVYEVPLKTYNTPHIEITTVNYEPMQYTGLKDKNGKDIYEGDITNDKEIVEFGNGGFYHFSIAGWEGSTEWETIEIIGNIHENGELLK